MGVGDYFIAENITQQRANSMGANCRWYVLTKDGWGKTFRRKKIGEGRYKFWRAA